MALTQKNKLFIQEYIKQNYTNATKAWQTVYECEYSTAKVQASKALKKPEIIEYMQEFQRQQYQEAGITAERIAMELAKMAFNEEEKATARTKALDLLQKQLGLQTQKVDANVNQEQTIEVKIEN